MGLHANEGTDLEGMRDVLMASPYKRCRCALRIKHLGSLLLRVVLDNNCLRLIKLLYLTVPAG